MYSKNFSIVVNQSNSGPLYQGDTAFDARDYIRRYLSNNESLSIGRILDIYMASYSAQVSYRGTTTHAFFLSKALGGLSHTSDFSIPEAGALVLLWRDVVSGHTYILGCVSEDNIEGGIPFDVEPTGVDASSEKQHHLAFPSEVPSTQTPHNSGRPIDVFPGEIGEMNELGNTLALLRGLVLLKATDLSQIQLHTIDDLIKIVAKNLEIFTSFHKDVSYVRDGKCSREVDAYKNQDDLFGSTGPVDQPGTNYSMEPVENDPKPFMRMQLGDQGKLVSIFVEDNEECLAKVKISETGKLSINSTKEVNLMVSDTLQSQKRLNEYFNDANDNSLAGAVEYTPSDGSLETQSTDDNIWTQATYDTKQYPNKHWEHLGDKPTVFSQVSLKEGGTFLIKDFNGSFIESTAEGDIIISCPGNIIMRSGGSISTLAGHNLDLRAKDNIDVCTTEGDIRVKAEEAMQLYSKNKGVLIETPSSSTPDGGKGENHNYGGVKIVASGGPVSVISETSNVNIWAYTNAVMKGLTEARLESDVLASIKSTLAGVIMTGSTLDVIATGAMSTTALSSQVAIATTYNLGALVIGISGATTTSIFGGGAVGTLVNHVHDPQSDKYVYEPDGCPNGGTRVYSITKSGEAIPVAPGVVVLSPIDTLMSPFTKNILNLTTFSFRTEVFSGKLYETEWQRSASGIWNLITKDFIGVGGPFPGNGYGEYYSYAPHLGTLSEGGIFTGASLLAYKH